MDGFMEELNFSVIGKIHSPFKEPKDVPIQAIAGDKLEGWVEVYPEYRAGLKDLEGFSEIILIYTLLLGMIIRRQLDL